VEWVSGRILKCRKRAWRSSGESQSSIENMAKFAETASIERDVALNLQESIVYQFHSMLILHPPPMLIPPMPPEAAPVDEGIAIAAVAVGLMPDIGMELIISWFMAMMLGRSMSGLDYREVPRSGYC
jgi:hypothetical protein